MCHFTERGKWGISNPLCIGEICCLHASCQLLGYVREPKLTYGKPSLFSSSLPNACSLDLVGHLSLHGFVNDGESRHITVDAKAPQYVLFTFCHVFHWRLDDWRSFCGAADGHCCHFSMNLKYVVGYFPLGLKHCFNVFCSGTFSVWRVQICKIFTNISLFFFRSSIAKKTARRLSLL